MILKAWSEYNPPQPDTVGSVIVKDENDSN